MLPPRFATGRFGKMRGLPASMISRAIENSFGGGNLRRLLLDGAPFYAPLTNSLALSRGTGSQTLTRTTTHTVQNNDGYMVTCLSGEIPIKGGRRIYNLIPAAGGGSASLAVAANKSMTLAAGTYVFSMGAGTGTATFSGTGGATGTLDASASGRVSVSKTITAGTLVVTASVATLVDLQVESVDAQTTKTAGEYVSVGVLSSPWHGAGVDGVKWFTTDISGNPIAAATLDGAEVWPAATNLCLQSNAFSTTWSQAGTPSPTQNVTGPDGTTSAWTLTDNNVGLAEAIYQDITLTATTYTFSVFAKKTTGAQASYPILACYPGVSAVAICTVDTTNGVATVFSSYTGFTIASGLTARCDSFDANFWRVSMSFTGTAAAWTTVVYPAGTTNPTQSTGTVDAAAQGSVVIYGVQVELGSSATPYIATTTVAVTRNADVISVPTASNIAAAAGFIALEYTPQHAPSGQVALWGTYVDASNYTAILHDATNLIFRKRIAGVNYDATIANAFVSGTTYKMAASWGSSGLNIALGGTLGTPHANTTAAQIGTTMQTGADGNSASQPGMAIKNVYAGTRALSNSELRVMSS